jgi:glycosyltransferase domain-containing protein
MSPLTVVIFSRNRPARLSHAIARYVDAGMPVIVADGSDQPQPGKYVQLCTNYLHAPDTPVYWRIQRAISGVTTPAVVLAPDDDVMLPGTLYECASQLLQQSKWCRVCGTTVHVGPRDSNLRKAVPDLQVERVLDLKNPDNPVDRYHELLEHSPQVFYAVIRTEVAKAVSEVICSVPNDCALIGEQLWTVLPAVAGDTVLLDRLQFIRRIPECPPSYRQYRSGVVGIKSLKEWAAYTEIMRSLEKVSGKLGVPGDVAHFIAEHFACNNWLVSREAVVSSQNRSIVCRLGRGLKKYLRNPSALLQHSSRQIATGMTNRRLVRCSGYPWLIGDTGNDPDLGDLLRLKAWLCMPSHETSGTTVRDTAIRAAPP